MAEQIPDIAKTNASIQIQTGQVHKILPLNSWIIGMDPLFNLHLNLDGIAEAWVTLLVYFFGKRKPGMPELKNWTSLVASLYNPALIKN